MIIQFSEPIKMLTESAGELIFACFVLEFEIFCQKYFGIVRLFKT